MSNTASAVAAGSTSRISRAFDRGRDEALEDPRLPIDHRAAQRSDAVAARATWLPISSTYIRKKS